jgi:membrane protein YqaA with SNARE-associated domain
MRAFPTGSWPLLVPIGVVALAFLDSTLFFSLPFGIDAAVIILAARLERSGGSCRCSHDRVGRGAALTFWMGITIGEQGLERYVPPKRLKQFRRRISKRGAIALAVLVLIPPPFPFTLFVLAAGALKVKAKTFFVTLAAFRLVRFGLEAALAIIFGRRIVAWLDSDRFHDVVLVVIVPAVALTVLSLVRVIRSTRRLRVEHPPPMGRPAPARADHRRRVRDAERQHLRHERADLLAGS